MTDQQNPDTDQHGRPLGTTAQPGDTVTSRWSTTGIRWTVEQVIDGWNPTSPKHLQLRSQSSNRAATRSATDVVIVERAPDTTEETP